MRITLASMAESEEEIEGLLLVLSSADIYQGSLANDFIDLIEASRVTIGGKKTYPEAVKMAQKSFKNVKDLAAMAITSYDRGHAAATAGATKAATATAAKATRLARCPPSSPPTFSNNEVSRSSRHLRVGG
jgi:hypothetical protein